MGECERCGATVDGLDRFCDDCVDDPAARPSPPGDSSIWRRFLSQPTATKLVVAYLSFAAVVTVLGVETDVRLLLSGIEYGDVAWQNVRDLSVNVGVGVLYTILAVTLARGTGNPPAYANVLYTLAGFMLAYTIIVGVVPAADDVLPSIPTPIGIIAWEIALSNAEPATILDHFDAIRVSGIAVTAGVGYLLQTTADTEP
jgi:hypothetical protein